MLKFGRVCKNKNPLKIKDNSMFNLSIDKVDGKHFKNIDFEFTGDT